MPITITMPALSPTMTDGVIAKWLKNEGDLVNADDPLCEITTDKSTVEYQSLDKGYLRKILVPDGGTASVNQPIGILAETMEEDISQSLPKEEPKQEQAPEQKEDTAQKESAPTPQQAGGLSVMRFTPSPPRTHYTQERKDTPQFVSPLARKIAKERNLDLTSVTGSGPNGRIVSSDLQFAQESGPVVHSEEAPTIPPGTYEEIPLTPMRKAIGERLQAAKISIPHFYVTDNAHVDNLMATRSQLKEAGIKVSFNDFVIRATALALRAHPEINMGYNSENETLIKFKTIDISLAVSISDGLITPIIVHADYKSLVDLSREAKELATAAKNSTLTPEQYQGGSFTLSNLGMFGIECFDAVINPPQAGILAIGGIKEVPIVQDGAIRVGHTMALTLSGDHRVIDGKDGAVFLKTIVQYLENPAILLV